MFWLFNIGNPRGCPGRMRRRGLREHPNIRIQQGIPRDRDKDPLERP